MPTSYIKKLAAEGKGSVADLEKEWEEAKQSAKAEGQGSNYAYITKIFQTRVEAAASSKVKDLMLKCFNAVTKVLSDLSTKTEKKSQGFIVRFDQPPDDKDILLDLAKSIKSSSIVLDKPEYKQEGAGYSVRFKGSLQNLNCNIVYFVLNGEAAINVDCF